MADLTVLQLDTEFPRIPGDIGCAETFRGDVEILRVPGAHVERVVTGRPDQIDIRPFEAAVKAASGEIVTTSCGFLAPWQTHLQAFTSKPLVSSSLIALEHLAQDHAPDELVIATFDAKALGSAHLGQFQTFLPCVHGLRPDMHLRRVIAQGLVDLDETQAKIDVMAMLEDAVIPKTRTILLECTNLPPYKAAIKARWGLRVVDILTCIEAQKPGLVVPQFL